MDYFESLPEEVLIEIMSYFDQIQRLKFERVNRRFRHVSTSLVSNFWDPRLMNLLIGLSIQQHFDLMMKYHHIKVFNAYDLSAGLIYSLKDYLRCKNERNQLALLLAKHCQLIEFMNVPGFAGAHLMLEYSSNLIKLGQEPKLRKLGFTFAPSIDESDDDPFLVMKDIVSSCPDLEAIDLTFAITLTNKLLDSCKVNWDFIGKKLTEFKLEMDQPRNQRLGKDELEMRKVMIESLIGIRKLKWMASPMSESEFDVFSSNNSMTLQSLTTSSSGIPSFSSFKSLKELRISCNVLNETIPSEILSSIGNNLQKLAIDCTGFPVEIVSLLPVHCRNLTVLELRSYQTPVPVMEEVLSLKSVIENICQLKQLQILILEFILIKLNEEECTSLIQENLPGLKIFKFNEANFKHYF